MAVNFTTNEAEVEALYVGYFGRAGDPLGVNYWVGQLNSGAMTYPQIAASFSVQTEATTMYAYLANPNIFNSSAFINQVYQELFNRVADSAGLTYWQAQLTAGNNSPSSIGTFIQNVISGAQGADATTVENKVAVATYFINDLSTAHLLYNAAANAQGISEVISTDSTQASVTIQEWKLLNGNAPSSGGAAIATINAGSGNDIIIGTQLQIVADVINGGAETNSLYVNDTGAVTISDANFVNVSNIEKLVFSGVLTGLTDTIGAAQNAIATANGGVLDITVSSLAMASTSAINDSTIISGTNSLKLSLTDAASATSATMTITGSAHGADAITLNDATATNSDLFIINETGTGNVTVNYAGVGGDTTGGHLTLTLGSGTASVTGGTGFLAAANSVVITSGTGLDTINLSSTTHASTELDVSAAAHSTTTSINTVSNFQMTPTAGNADALHFATTAVLTTGELGGFTVTNGIATQTGATVATFIAAVAAATTAGAVAFSDGTNTWVGYADGSSATTTNDHVVELVGLQGATSVGTAAALAIHIV